MVVNGNDDKDDDNDVDDEGTGFLLRVGLVHQGSAVEDLVYVDRSTEEKKTNSFLVQFSYGFFLLTLVLDGMWLFNIIIIF